MVLFFTGWGIQKAVTVILLVSELSIGKFYRFKFYRVFSQNFTDFRGVSHLDFHVYKLKVDFSYFLLCSIFLPLTLKMLTFYELIYSTPIEACISRLGMSVTTQGGSGRQYVTGSRRNLSKYRFVLLNVYRFRET